MAEEGLSLLVQRLRNGGRDQAFERQLAIFLCEALAPCRHVLHDVLEHKTPNTLQALQLFSHLLFVEALQTLDICKIDEMDETAAYTLQSYQWLLFHVL